MIISREKLINMPRVFSKNEAGNFIEMTLQDDPVISPYPFIYFTCDRDPTATEPVYIGYSGLIYFWWNTVSTNLFCCTNSNTQGSLVWQQIAMPQNILSMINGAGWKINTARNFSQRSSPAFNTSYMPSSTNDTTVIVSVNLTSTLLVPATVNLQVDTGSGFFTIIPFNLPSSIALTLPFSGTIPVPPGSSYKLNQTSGGGSIVNIYELSL